MLRLLFGTIVGACCLALSPSALSADATLERIDDLAYEPGNAGAEELVGYLDSDESQHRWRAARALGVLRHKPATTKLAALLSDKDPIVQLQAVVALTRIGDASPETVDAIVEKVASEDARVARIALGALRRLKPGPEKLAAAIEHALQSSDHAVMSHAMEAMVAAGGKATPLIKEALKKEKASYWAALAVAEIGPDAAGAAPELAELIADCKNPHTLQQAILAVAALGPAGKPAAEAVTQVANNTDEEGARVAACYALGELGDPASCDLLRRLDAEGGEMQKMVCAWSLAMLNPDDQDAKLKAAKLLATALTSEQAELRQVAASGLWKLKAPPEVTAPLLMAAMEEVGEEGKSNMAAALASLGPDVLDRAINALQKPEFRDIAIEVIGRLGPEAGDAVAPLVKVFPHATKQQQARINFALASIGPSAGAAGDLVTMSLKDPDPAVRQSALFALRRMGKSGRASLEELIEFHKSSGDDFEKLAAAWAASAMAPDGAVVEVIVEALGQGLDHPDAKARYETVHAILDLGPVGKPLLEKLRRLANADADLEVSEAAEEALKRLEE